MTKGYATQLKGHMKPLHKAMVRLLCISIVMGVIGVVGSSNAQTQTLGQEKALILAYYRAWNEGDFVTKFAEFHTPDTIYFTSNGTFERAVGVEVFTGLFRSAFPDSVFLVTEMITSPSADGVNTSPEGAYELAVTWLFGGTHQGAFLNAAPSNTYVVLSGTTLFQLEEGKIKQAFLSYDTLPLLRQVGLAPIPEMSPPTAAKADMVVKEARDMVNTQRPELIPALFTPDTVLHTPVGHYSGAEGIANGLLTIFSGLTNAHIELRHVLIMDDQAIVWWRLTGAHNGDLANIPASQGMINLNGTGIVTFSKDMRIHTVNAMWDQTRLLRQLGQQPTFIIGEPSIEPGEVRFPDVPTQEDAPVQEEILENAPAREEENTSPLDTPIETSPSLHEEDTDIFSETTESADKEVYSPQEKSSEEPKDILELHEDTENSIESES